MNTDQQIVRSVGLLIWRNIQSSFRRSNCYTLAMARYRRNIDEDVRETERRWVQTRDHGSGVAYARHLLRAGQLELTEFPLSILRELFPDGVADSATLFGFSIGSIKELLEEAMGSMMQQAAANQNQGALHELSKHYKVMYATDTLVWFVDSHELSWRCNWKHFNTQSVRLQDGEIDEESLSNQYTALQVDFTLPGHSTGNSPFYAFHHIVSLDADLTDHRGYYDEQIGRNANYLVIFDEITDAWDNKPRAHYGRCEDFPCCNHDICPPREESSGVQLAMSCTCGRLVPRNASSSLCERCLRGVRREAYYGEDYEPEFDDADEFGDDVDSDDDDVDGSGEDDEPDLFD